MESIRGCELCAVSHTEVTDVLGENKDVTKSKVEVNTDYWHVLV